LALIAGTVSYLHMIGWVIATWPSFALTASYELLTRQVCGSAAARDGHAELERASAQFACSRARSAYRRPPVPD
jgi:hypothetical protein